MKKQNLLIALVFAILGFMVPNQNSYAHCEIPCGIYGDSMRIYLIQEHILTIEKSMKMIIELSEESEKNYNQIVRWVTNKEEHCNKIQEIVSQYFLHQRIKIVESSSDENYEKYVKQLSLLHKLQVYSMKAKQTTDLSYIQRLSEVLDEFSNSYFHVH